MNWLKKFLLIACLFLPLSSFLSFAYSDTLITIEPGVYFQGEEGSGYISFNSTCTASNIFWQYSFVVFQNITMLSYGDLREFLGFYSSASANMTILKFNSTAVVFNVTCSEPGISHTRVFESILGSPVSVTGATSWYYNSTDTATYITYDGDYPKTITVSWAWEEVEDPVTAAIEDIENTIYAAVIPLLNISLIMISFAVILTVLKGNLDPTGILTIVRLAVTLIIFVYIISAIINAIS